MGTAISDLFAGKFALVSAKVSHPEMNKYRFYFNNQKTLSQDKIKFKRNASLFGRDILSFRRNLCKKSVIGCLFTPFAREYA